MSKKELTTLLYDMTQEYIDALNETLKGDFNDADILAITLAMYKLAQSNRDDRYKDMSLLALTHKINEAVAIFIMDAEFNGEDEDIK